MKWVLSHATDEFHHWLLQQEEGSRSLVFHRQRLTLRLNGFSKRLFFLDEQGFLQKKLLLRSEYGVVMGETGFGENASLGALNCNGLKFFYQVKNGTLSLFDGDKNPVSDCSFPPADSLARHEYYSLLFGFAWFVTADAALEKKKRLPKTA